MRRLLGAILAATVLSTPAFAEGLTTIFCTDAKLGGGTAFIIWSHDDVLTILPGGQKAVFAEGFYTWAEDGAVWNLSSSRVVAINAATTNEGICADISLVARAKISEILETDQGQKALAATLREQPDKEVALQAEQAAAEALREKLRNADTELVAMTLALEATRREAEGTLTLLAATDAARKDLYLRLSQEQVKSTDAERKLALLNQQVTALRGQISVLQATLDDTATRSDSTAKVQIEILGRQLNSALATVAIEQRRNSELEAAEQACLEGR